MKHRLGPCSPSVHHTLEGVLYIEKTFNILFLEHQVLRGIPSEVDVIVRCELQPNCVNSEKVKVKNLKLLSERLLHLTQGRQGWRR